MVMAITNERPSILFVCSHFSDSGANMGICIVHCIVTDATHITPHISVSPGATH